MPFLYIIVHDESPGPRVAELGCAAGAVSAREI